MDSISVSLVEVVGSQVLVWLSSSEQMVGYYHNGGQLQHGLVRGSFIPDRPQRELRDLTRYRKSLIRDRASAVNRLQKVLEDANNKLASVATDIMGVSARSMLQAIAGGEQDSVVLSSMAPGTAA